MIYGVVIILHIIHLQRVRAEWGLKVITTATASVVHSIYHKDRDLCCRWLIFLWVIQIKNKYKTFDKKKRQRRNDDWEKKTANDYPIVFLIVCSRVWFVDDFSHDTNIQSHAHHTSKYRFAVMYLLLRLIVLNLAHKNSNVFVSQMVCFYPTSKRNKN